MVRPDGLNVPQAISAANKALRSREKIGAPVIRSIRSSFSGNGFLRRA